MKIAVFDFDGVIVDSRKAIFEVMNEIAKLKKVPFLKKEELLNYSTKQLLKRLKIRWYEIPRYYKLARKIVNLNKDKIVIEAQILEMFQNVNLDKIIFIILSSNSKILISEFVAKHLYEIKFTEIIGDVSLFKKSRKIKQVMKKYEVNKKDIIYIGDEVRDIHAAKKANIQSIAVLWGKENETLLSKENPTFIVKTGIELSHLLNDFSLKN